MKYVVRVIAPGEKPTSAASPGYATKDEARRKVGILIDAIGTRVYAIWIDGYDDAGREIEQEQAWP